MSRIECNIHVDGEAVPEEVARAMKKGTREAVERSLRDLSRGWTCPRCAAPVVDGDTSHRCDPSALERALLARAERAESHARNLEAMCASYERDIKRLTGERDRACAKLVTIRERLAEVDDILGGNDVAWGSAT